jgi:hypothetical protein
MNTRDKNKKAVAAFVCFLFLTPSTLTEQWTHTAAVAAEDAVTTPKAENASGCSTSRMEGKFGIGSLESEGGLLLLLGSLSPKAAHGEAQPVRLMSCVHSRPQEAQRTLDARMEHIIGRVEPRQVCTISHSIAGANCPAAQIK